MKTFPPPPTPPLDAPSSEQPTVFLFPHSTPTVKRAAPTSSTAPIARSRSPVPSRSKSAVSFVRGVAVGIAMTSVALLAIAVVMGAPIAWRGVAQVRPVAMHLVENVRAREARAEPNAKADVVVSADPKSATRGATSATHRERLLRERASSRALKPSKKILEQAL